VNSANPAARSFEEARESVKGAIGIFEIGLDMPFAEFLSEILGHHNCGRDMGTRSSGKRSKSIFAGLVESSV
jgi:hypothetical protein